MLEPSVTQFPDYLLGILDDHIEQPDVAFVHCVNTQEHDLIHMHRGQVRYFLASCTNLSSEDIAQVQDYVSKADPGVVPIVRVTPMEGAVEWFVLVPQFVKEDLARSKLESALHAGKPAPPGLA